MDAKDVLLASVFAAGGSGGGSGGGAEPLHINTDSNTKLLDKTWNDIHSAFTSGKLCFIHAPGNVLPDWPNGFDAIVIGVSSYYGFDEYAGRTIYSVDNGYQLSCGTTDPDSFPMLSGINDA